MGRAKRPRPARLGAKLLQIRRCLGFSQRKMMDVLSYSKSYLVVGHISLFEQDKREPPLPLLLRYARVAGVNLETLVDDELDLPKRIGGRILKN